MDPSKLLHRLKSLETIGIKLGLQNIQTLLASLKNPQDRYFSILIAGTNGKGSVGAMIERILVRNGIPAGYYVSPHLIEVRERIRWNGNMIAESEFFAGLNRIFEAVDSLRMQRKLEAIPTYFETLTAVALDYFERKAAKVVVLEAGLGGRFDATNVVRQNVSVITGIDFDHEEHLGSSLREIALEKAWICKKEAPLVTGPLIEEARSAVREVVDLVRCPWIESDLSTIESLHLKDGFPVFFYRPWNQELRVNLRGKHQAQNAMLALKVADLLNDRGFDVRREAVIKALDEVEWPGRLQLIQKEPPVLIDCAHNPAGVRTLADFLKEMQWQSAIGLFTAMKDKKLNPMLGEISGALAEIILTRIDPLDRCASLEDLSAAAKQAGIRFRQIENADEALIQAKLFSQQSGRPLIVFGSIYLAGALLKRL